MIWQTTTGAIGAPSLVLIHGSLDRSAGLSKLSRRLDPSYRVTRYDRRGYGRSRPSDGPYGIDAQVDDLASVLDGVATPTVLFGHSFGGNVALAMAQRHPELVGGVVVYESPLSWLTWWPGQSATAAAGSWADDPEAAAETFMRGLIGDARWERLPLSTQTERRSEGPAMLGELAGIRADAPWHADQISVPVLAIAGEHGRPHHRQAMAHIAETIRHGTAATVTGAAHFGPTTHPAVVARLIDRFVTEVAS